MIASKTENFGWLGITVGAIGLAAPLGSTGPAGPAGPAGSGPAGSGPAGSVASGADNSAAGAAVVGFGHCTVLTPVLFEHVAVPSPHVSPTDGHVEPI